MDGLFGQENDVTPLEGKAVFFSILVRLATDLNFFPGSSVNGVRYYRDRTEQFHSSYIDSFFGSTERQSSHTGTIPYQPQGCLSLTRIRSIGKEIQVFSLLTFMFFFTLTNYFPLST